MSFARNSFYTTLTQILIQFLGILSGVVMARMLGPEGRGVYALYFTNSQLVFTFSSLSINTALMYFVSSGKVTKEKMLGLTFLINLVSAVVSIVIILGVYVSPFHSIVYPEDYFGWVFLVWLILYSLLQLLSATYTSFFQAMRYFPKLNKNNLIISVVSFVGFASLYYFRDKLDIKVELFLYVLFFTHLMGVAYFAYSLHRQLKIKPSWKFNFKQDFPGLKHFVLTAHLSIVINFINYKFSTWVIHYLIDEAALGWYSLAVNLGGFFTLITEPLAMVLTPYLAVKEKEEKTAMFQAYFRIFFWVMLVFSAVAFFIAPWLIPWVYGIAFQPSVILFQIALPGIFLAGLIKILAAFVLASGKQEYNLYATIVGFVCAISTNLLLVKQFQEQGAIVANLITYFGVFITLLWFGGKKLQINISKIFFLSLSDLQLLKNGAKKLLNR